MASSSNLSDLPSRALLKKLKLWCLYFQHVLPNVPCPDLPWLPKENQRTCISLWIPPGCCFGHGWQQQFKMRWQKEKVVERVKVRPLEKGTMVPSSMSLAVVDETVNYVISKLAVEKWENRSNALKANNTKIRISVNQWKSERQDVGGIRCFKETTKEWLKWCIPSSRQRKKQRRSDPFIHCSCFGISDLELAYSADLFGIGVEFIYIYI